MSIFKKRKKSKRKKILEKRDDHYDSHIWSKIPDPDPDLAEADSENELLNDRKIVFQSPFSDSEFKLKVNKLTTSIRDGVRTEIFKKTLILFSAFFLMGFGYFGSKQHYKNYLYNLSMSVSAIDEVQSFALSGTSITVKQQYRTNDTFLVPFKIASFTSLPSVAKDYSLVLQGKTMDIDPDTRAKFILYGDSGDGAILIQGKFTGEPMNIYIQSNNSIIGDISGDFDEISSSELEKSISKGDFYLLDELNNSEPKDPSEKVYVGSVYLNGYDVNVTEDLVVFSLNPLADNVRVVDDLYFDMPFDQIYDNVLTLSEKDSIRLNLTKADEKKLEVIDIMRQYEERLKSDYRFDNATVSTILQVDNYAIDALGSAADIKFINSMLNSAGVDELMSSNSTSSDISMDDMSEDDYQEALKEEAALLNSFSTGGDDTKDVLELLNEARSALMSLNKQMVLYEYRQTYLNELGEQIAPTISSVESYTIVRPYKALKQN